LENVKLIEVVQDNFQWRTLMTAVNFAVEYSD